MKCPKCSGEMKPRPRDWGKIFMFGVLLVVAVFLLPVFPPAGVFGVLWLIVLLCDPGCVCQNCGGTKRPFKIPFWR